MRAKICPVCKSKFYEENFESDFVLHDVCFTNKKSEDSKERPVRTSTPVADIEYIPSPSFSDSVTDFFYQSWKSGLHSDDKSSMKYSVRKYQPFTVIQPLCYTPQLVYVNTFVFTPYVPTSYVQQVGYRPDGTFGVLPTYWS